MEGVPKNHWEVLGAIDFFTVEVWSFRGLLRYHVQFCEHYHHERNHQGLGNEVIDPEFSPTGGAGEVNCRERLGGLLRCYYREAA